MNMWNKKKMLATGWSTLIDTNWLPIAHGKRRLWKPILCIFVVKYYRFLSICMDFLLRSKRVTKMGSKFIFLCFLPFSFCYCFELVFRWQYNDCSKWVEFSNLFFVTLSLQIMKSIEVGQKRYYLTRNWERIGFHCFLIPCAIAHRFVSISENHPVREYDHVLCSENSLRGIIARGGGRGRAMIPRRDQGTWNFTAERSGAIMLSIPKGHFNCWGKTWLS